MPSLFKRKPVEVPEPDVEPAEPVTDTSATSQRPMRRTPSKRELGVPTPKRRDDTRRRPEPPPANRREAMKRAREKARQDRTERRTAMMAGDERYLLPRDKGPERAMVRDIVDRRPTVGTWFFGGALLVLIGSSQAMPRVVQLASNLLWALLALATLADSALLGREVKRRMRQRFPDSDLKLGSLYFYAAMRGLTFRRLRIPKPRVKLGDRI